MKIINSIIYGLSGILTIAIGVIAILLPTGTFAELAQSYSKNDMHIIQELGAGLIFVGLMFFWCIFNYQRRKIVHFFLIIFFMLFSLIHWLDYTRGVKPLISAAYNSVPIIILSLMAFWSRSDKKEM